MAIYLLTGMVFLVIGFSALLNIRIQVKRDVQKAQKLGKLIMRIGVFSFLYIVPKLYSNFAQHIRAGWPGYLGRGTSKEPGMP